MARDKDANYAYLAETTWIIKSMHQDFLEIGRFNTSKLSREIL